MNSEKKLLHAAAHMEKTLAKTIKTASENDCISPKQLNELVTLVSKKEIVLANLLTGFEKKKPKQKHIKYMYIANYNGDNVAVYRLRDPLNPEYVTIFNVDIDAPSGLAIKKNILYVTNYEDNRIDMFKLLSPTSAVHIGEFRGGNLLSPESLLIRGDTLYVTSRSSDLLQIYDISRPHKPRFVREIN